MSDAVEKALREHKDLFDLIVKAITEEVDALRDPSLRQPVNTRTMENIPAIMKVVATDALTVANMPGASGLTEIRQ
jgi:hypothetical protein